MKALQLRDQHLEVRVTAAMIAGDSGKAKAINHIKRVETLKAMYQKVHFMKNKKTKSQFNHLVVPQNDTTDVITNPDIMIHHLIQRNQQHFGQAQGTPFTIPPLDTVSTIDQLRAISMEDLASLSEATQEIIHYLTTAPQQSFINTLFTDKDLYQMYSRWNARQQLLTDLSVHIKTVSTDNTAFIIMMDANETYTDKNSALATWMQHHALIDVHMYLHNLDTDIPTHIRGTKRIDFILATANILPYIIHGGILPYHFLLSTDHRSLYIDIELKKFLRCQPPTTTLYIQRLLKSNNPRGIQQYGKFLTKWLDKSTIEQELQQAQDNAYRTNSTTTVSSERIQLLETQFTLARLKAEKTLQRTSRHPWSPRLRQAQMLVTYYKQWVSQYKTQRNLQTNRQRLQLENIPDPKNLTQAQHYLRQAQKTLKETINHAQQLRELHLEDRAQAAQNLNNVTKTQAINQIRKVEALKNMYRRIRRLTTNGDAKRFTHLIVTTQDHDNMIQEPEEIFQHLIHRNTKHFSQANGTPFTITPWQHITTMSQLNQADIPQPLSEAQGHLIQTLLHQPQLPPTNSTITKDDLISLYQKWREATSTSPSGIHLGHDKSVFTYNDNNAQNTLANRIYTIKSQFINYALTNNTVYERWKHINTIMIEKIPGVFHIDKLRALHLFESDLNAIYGILWGKRLMHNAENHNRLHESQHGSRKGRGTETILLTKHFTYALWRLTQTNGMTFNNDAKACYDRIVMNFALLASQQLGMPMHICQWYHNMLKMAQYHIQLPNNISETYYHHTPEKPLHGPGQGSRAAPSLWVIVSSLLMQCMQDKSQGISFQDPMHQNTVKHIMTGFVDDTTHWINDFPRALRGRYEYPAMAQATQQTAQWWEQLLHASGGKLELKKCFYYNVSWEFNREGEPTITRQEDTNPIQITSSENGTSVMIDEKIPTKSHKTLGVYENPSGDYRDEYQQLLHKSKKWKTRILNQILTKQELRLLYHSFYLPSLRYHLTIGTYSQQQLDKVQHSTIQIMLSRLGYNPNMPKEVVYGPTRAGGIGFQHLFVT